MSVIVIGDIGVVGGMFHIGDEAMFEASCDRLRDRGLEVVGVSSAPEESAARYGIRTLPRLGFEGLDRPAARARAQLLESAAAGRATLSAGDPAAAVLRELDTATGVLNAGGGNLASRWPIHIDERSTLAAMARARGLPVVVSGQTFGPDLDPGDTEILTRMLRDAALVSVREPDSLAWAHTQGLEPELGVDDASFLAEGDGAASGDPTPGSAADLDREREVVVSLSGWFAGRPAAEVEQRIAELLDDAARRVGPIVFHAHFGPVDPDAPAAGDAALHERVRARMSEPSRVVPTGDSVGAARLARGAALLITSRYHPAVFAAPAGVPILALSADAYTKIKLGGALGHWGQDVVLDMDDLADGPALLTRLDAERGLIADAAARRLPPHRAEARRWWDHVAAALRG